ncbi:MAG: 50S ribosomal protein L24 [Myxococcota bacterium]|jgi:large subunit ribosomal protein L24|nr:50S ribosomal protein L24 [Myxococcota bacterium]
MHVKTNDKVVILAGKDRGKSGKITRVILKKNRVVVEKLNLIKRHQKPNQQNRAGGIVEKEAPLHSSNVALFCATCNKGVRATVRFVGESGEKFRTPAEAQATIPEGSNKRVRKVRTCVHCGQSFD